MDKALSARVQIWIEGLEKLDDRLGRVSPEG